jgi:hypothetical protein
MRAPSHLRCQMRQFALIACIAALLAPSLTEARTWRVERDGSGDFTTLQPALDAAARGDTVQIGPGRYDETAPFTTAGWTAETHAAVKADSLVLIGTDRDAVVIGPAQFDGSAVDLKGIAMARELTHLTVLSLTVQNVWHGLFAFGSLTVRTSTLKTCDSGILALTPRGMQVMDSRFEGCLVDGIFTGTDTRDVQIVNCEFSGNSLGVGINRTQNAVVASCSFAGGGVQYAENSTGTVQDCNFAGPYAVTLALASTLVLQHNRLQVSDVGIWVQNLSHLLGGRNTVQGAAYADLLFAGGGTASFHDNHVLKGAGLSVRTDGYVLDPVHIDLKNNFWGTASTDSISAWILDGNDPHPPWETWNGFVDFEPFSARPIPTDQKTMGGLKAIFRE